MAVLYFFIGFTCYMLFLSNIDAKILSIEQSQSPCNKYACLGEHNNNWGDRILVAFVIMTE